MFRRSKAPGRKWKLMVVSHTHWDREWYLPFQQFRASLVEAIDSLLELMAADPGFRYFTLDGQTIVLEDYLEARPERERDLGRLIEDGRILIGPWYVMPDEFLVSGESLVRNLMEGARVASTFGPVLKVGYIPDPFGHIAQMPQILRGFGIDSAVLWRGVGSDLRNTEALWAAPDGSEVLLEHLPGGYANAAVLPATPKALMERLSHLRAQLQPRATTRYLLLMNGNDHMFPQTDVPAAIAEGNRGLRDAEMIHGTLPMLLAGIREEAAATGVEWQRLLGEFRSSELAHLLAGVLSARMGIKQRNFRCETLLERWAEPFSTFEALVRPSFPSLPLLRLAWRYLLKNQPHDSICGCSIDQVHQEMETRYDWCEQVAGLVADRALEALAEAVDTDALLGGGAGQGAVVVFNSEDGPRTDFVTALVQLSGVAEGLTLFDAGGHQVPCQLLRERRTELASATLGREEMQAYLRLAGPGKSWPHWKLRFLEKIVRAALRDRFPNLVVAGMDVLPGADPNTVDVEVEAASGREHNLDSISEGMRQISILVDRGDARYFRLRVRRRDQAEIGFVAPEMPAHGLKAFYLGSAPPDVSSLPTIHEEFALENEFLSVELSPEDGSVRLIDRETGAIYWGINSFLDGGDAGDEYTYSPPVEDRIVDRPEGRPSVTMEEQGPARHLTRVELALRLPVGLTDDRRARSEETVLCPITTWLALYPGVPRLDVRTVVTNLARDHRLRVHFPTHLQATSSYADGQFAVIQRPLQPAVPIPGWIEHPVSTNPQLAFVDVNDGQAGLMVANRGLPEYDVAMLERGPCIAITLLRCVGWLSRDDLTTRQGAAGPLVATPGAQMPGVHTFEYSIIPHSGGWENAMHQAYSFARPLRARWTGRHPGSLQAETSFLAVSPSSLLVSAVKRAEDGSGDVVVRVYNALGIPSTAELRALFPFDLARLASLAEEPGEELPVEGGRGIRFPIGPHQIVTLRLSPTR